jgi:SAM-dependent methyltransferase
MRDQADDDGFVLSRLPGPRWIGVDEALDDLRIVWRHHRIPVVAASGQALPLRVRFDMVAAFDVLEHIEDDIGALRAWRALLTPPGHLVITVPAGPELWSRRDDFAGHCRRYSRAGLRVERLRPLFRTLWPLAWLSARVSRGTAVSDPVAEYQVSGLLNVLLRFLVRTEEWLLHGSDRGRGTSWLLVARPTRGAADGSAA